MATESNDERVAEADETVLVWSPRKATFMSLSLVAIVLAIVVAHLFFLSAPMPGFILIAGIFTLAAFPWAKRALSPTEAFRITAEGIVDKTSPMGVERVIPWSKIQDVHLKNGFLGLEVVDTPAPSFFERVDKFVRGAKGNYFIPANSLDVPAGTIFEICDRRLQQRVLDEPESEARQGSPLGHDI